MAKFLEVQFTLLVALVRYSGCDYGNANFRLPAGHNPLNGKHLRTVWTLWRRENATRVFGPRVMTYLLEYLAQRLNFTYTMVENVTETTVERPRGGGRRGLVDYLLDGSGDILAHDITNNPDRFAVMDFSLPWIYGEASFLIPVADPNANVGAVLQPFQWQVWVSLITSIAIVIVTIFIFNGVVNALLPRGYNASPFQSATVESRQLDAGNANTSLYVFGVLMSQGGPCLWWALSIRLVAAAWCLAAFVLVNSYCSTLITYVISHYNPPLIESVHDLVRDSTITLVVEKGKGFELTFTDPTIQSPIFVKVRQKLASNPITSRCYGVDDCVNRVKNGYRNVFAQAKVYLFDAIIRDFTQTGKCSIELAKQPFYSSIPVSLGLQKRSPFTTTVSRVVLETFDYGFHWHWQSIIRPLPTAARECWSQSERGVRRTKANSAAPDKLTLYNLTGAFVVLAIGFTASLVAFVAELAVVRFCAAKRERSRIQVPQNMTRSC